jgi:ornithine cyclodeaminase/alanine dehydrogenase-like protein (mu-crystallin family)
VQQPGVSLISRGDIARYLSVSRSLELARGAYAATATGHAMHSSLGHVAAPDGEFHIKGSGLVLDGRLFATVKVVAYFPERTTTLKLPSIVGLIELFDGANGQPLAVMESELITKLRTAAGTAVALDQLARADARRLLVCGTGAQALPHIEAVAAIRDLESVQLWGRSPERAQATLAQLRERFPDLQSDIAHDVSAAARLADLIVCLTSAAKPYLHTGDVRPGTTIAAVGSDTPEKAGALHRAPRVGNARLRRHPPVRPSRRASPRPPGRCQGFARKPLGYTSGVWASPRQVAFRAAGVALLVVAMIVFKLDLPEWLGIVLLIVGAIGGIATVVRAWHDARRASSESP